MLRLIVISFVLLAAPLLAQDTVAVDSQQVAIDTANLPEINTEGQELGTIELEGEELPAVFLNDVNIQSREFSSWKEKYLFERLEAKVIKVYPYALIAKQLLDNIDADLDGMERKRDERRYKKAKTEELMAKFEEELKNLYVSEGKLLVKLINRETDNNCYRLIKELKGGIYARMWQFVAKKYGYNLKDPYVAEDEADIEYIMNYVEPTFKMNRHIN